VAKMLSKSEFDRIVAESIAPTIARIEADTRKLQLKADPTPPAPAPQRYAGDIRYSASWVNGQRRIAPPVAPRVVEKAAAPVREEAAPHIRAVVKAMASPQRLDPQDAARIAAQTMDRGNATEAPGIFDALRGARLARLEGRGV
jgi:hypothetical protein